MARLGVYGVLVAQLADLLTFVYMVRTLGPDAEAHPVTRAALSMSIGLAVAAKVALLVFLVSWVRAVGRFTWLALGLGIAAGIVGTNSNLVTMAVSTPRSAQTTTPVDMSGLPSAGPIGAPPTPRASVTVPSSALPSLSVPASEASTVPSGRASGVPITAPPSPAVVPVPSSLSRISRSGTASHVGAGFGPTYLALPWGRGIRVEVCGQAACWIGTSNDVGPDQRIHPDRVADLSIPVFELVCGIPASRGLCPVTVTRLDP